MNDPPYPFTVPEPTTEVAGNPECRTCAYFQHAVAEEGECRLGEPMLAGAARYQPRNHSRPDPYRGVWPQVLVTEWCGNHQERGRPQ